MAAGNCTLTSRCSARSSLPFASMNWRTAPFTPLNRAMLTVDGLPARGLSVASGANYGYLLARMTDGGHWRGEVRRFDASGEPQSPPLATCGLPLVDGRLCRRGEGFDAGEGHADRTAAGGEGADPPGS